MWYKWNDPDWNNKLIKILIHEINLDKNNTPIKSIRIDPTYYSQQQDKILQGDNLSSREITTHRKSRNAKLVTL